MSPPTLTIEQLERASGQVLQSKNGATPGADALRESLTEQLGLDTVHLAVTGVDIFGRGPEARVDIHLSGSERPLRFDRFADIGKPTALAAHLVTQTGVPRGFKVPDAMAIAGSVFQLARHHAEADEDEAASEWGCEYLRVAPSQEVDFGDQQDRWRAFSAMARVNPAESAGEDRSAHALAAASLVLIDREGSRRLVRTGWFQAYVKREVGGLYSPVALATQMQRVGWTRPNSQGRIKASSPTDARTLSWRFYVVGDGWEDQQQVTAGSQLNAHADARARNVGTPAITDNPNGSNGASNGAPG